MLLKVYKVYYKEETTALVEAMSTAMILKVLMNNIGNKISRQYMLA